MRRALLYTPFRWSKLLVVIVATIASIAVTSSAVAQNGLFGKPLQGVGGGPLAGASGDVVEAQGRILAPQAGQPAVLEVTATIQPPWHIYSITQKPGGPIRTKLKLTGSPDVQLAGDFQVITPPSSHVEPLFDNLLVEEHSGKAVWQAPLQLGSNVDLRSLKISGAVFAQACSDSCIAPKNYAFTAVLDPNAKVAAANFGGGAAQTGEPNPPLKKPQAPAERATAPALAPAADLFAPIAAAVGGNAQPAAGGQVGPFAVGRTHASVNGLIGNRTVPPGAKTELLITADVELPYHVYPLKETDAGSVGYKPTLIKMLPAAGLLFGKPEPIAPPNGAHEGVSYYEGQANWKVEIQVAANTPPGPIAVEGFIGLQTCQENNCDLPAGAHFRGTLLVGAAAGGPASEPLAFSLAKYGEASPRYGSPPATQQAVSQPDAGQAVTKSVGPIATPAPEKPAATTVGTDKIELVELNSAGTKMSLLFVVLSSLLGGALLNLMPCVLPVIGLKVMSFANQGGQSRARILALNLWYTAGLMLVFLVLATFAAGAKLGLTHTDLKWGEQFSSTGFNVVMSCVVFAMALSFLGIWEIPLPGFVGTGKATELAAQEGYSGAFFKGVMSTILATPCSGPFLGPVFGFMLKEPAYVTYLVFVCIGLGMSFPYLLIGVFPALVRWLPKPGVWMDTFKQLMGFVLLGTVVFLMMSLKHEYVVPTFATLIGVWAGCWWIGRTSLAEVTGKKVLAWTQGGVFAAAAAWFSFAVLVPQRPLLPWKPFTAGAPAQLASAGKTVMVDFSAEWCLACKYNLKTAINIEEVREIVEANGVVPLLADWTDGSAEVSEALAALDCGAIPVLAIFPAGQPNRPLVLRDVITKGQVLDALKQAGPSRDVSPATKTARSDQDAPAMQWLPFSPAVRSQLVAEGKTVLINFTADWDFTSKWNLKTAIETGRVQQLVNTNGVVTLIADWTDLQPANMEAAAAFEINSTPALVILPANHPDKPIRLLGELRESQLLDALKQAGPSRDVRAETKTAQASAHR